MCNTDLWSIISFGLKVKDGVRHRLVRQSVYQQVSVLYRQIFQIFMSAERLPLTYCDIQTLGALKHRHTIRWRK